ncbi:MAG: GNAT family N-acetyltransferase [Pirellulales bacterium]|nr:GNAT family N-acetyltransferase [Pirellulales bacterium]
MSANLFSSRPDRSTPSSQRPGPPDPLRLVAASAADFPAIQYFLTEVFGRPVPTEYRLAKEDPFFEPHDRLLFKAPTQIVGHVHTTRRVMQLGPVAIPSAGIHWLGILPGFQGQGRGSRLLRAAECHATAQGALVGLLRTRIPHFFRRTGWALCGGDPRSQAPARAILSEMLRCRAPLRRRRSRLSVRCWRRMELPALARIYRENLSGTCGPLERTEAYWQWLIRRHAYDQIYVALNGPDLLELEETLTPIVGYAVTRGERILELLTAPDCPAVAGHLLVRACRDAIEADRHWITLHAPDGHRLHGLFGRAGGREAVVEPDRGEVLMARLLAPMRLLRRLAPVLVERAVAAGLPRSFELGLTVDRRKFLLARRHDAMDVLAGRIGRSSLRLNVADFTRLVLGQLDWDEALASGRLAVSTALASRLGSALFPRSPWWRPPLDDLPT